MVRVEGAVEDLAWVEQAVGIERALDRAQQFERGIAELAGQESLLGEADPVFAGERAAEGQRVVEDLLHRGLDAVHFLLIALVGQKRRVEIPVAEMPERRDLHLVAGGGLVDEADHLGEFAPRDGGIFQDRGRPQAGEGGEGAPPGGGEARGLVSGGGAAHREGGLGAADLLDPLGLVSDCRRVAIGLDQQQGLGLGG